MRGGIFLKYSDKFRQLIGLHVQYNPQLCLITAYLLLGFASRLVDWIFVLLGLSSVLLLVLLGRLKSKDNKLNSLATGATRGS